MQINGKTISKTLAALLLFVTLYMWWNAAEAGMLELGPTMVGSDLSEGGMLYYGERFDDKWDVGIGLISTQEYKGLDIGQNAYITAQRIVKDPWTGRVELGLGIAYFQNSNRGLGCNFTFQPSVTYAGDRFTVGYRHFSNGGSCRPNAGQNGIMFGWRF